MDSQNFLGLCGNESNLLYDNQLAGLVKGVSLSEPLTGIIDDDCYNMIILSIYVADISG